MKRTVSDEQKHDARVRTRVRALGLLAVCGCALTAAGLLNENENRMIFLHGHQVGCQCINCQNARNCDREEEGRRRQEEERARQEEERRRQKGRYVRTGVFETYEPSGIREKHDADLRRLGVVSWSYLVKETAFSPRVKAQFTFADGRVCIFDKKCKTSLPSPLDIVREWLVNELKEQGHVAGPVQPSAYKNRQAFVDAYVSYRMRTAPESEKKKYRGKIEGMEKSFRLALIQEANRAWRNAR